MVRSNILFRSTIGASLLSALLLSGPAHAGLLGGGGGLAAGFGGGLNGGLTPRSLSVSGEGTGSVSRNGAPVPRGEKAARKADEGVQGAKDAGSAAAAKGADTQAQTTQSAQDKGATLRERIGQVGGSATSSTGAAATVSRDGASRAAQADVGSQASGMVGRNAPSATPAPSSSDAPAAPTSEAQPAAPAPTSAGSTDRSLAGKGGMAVTTQRADASAQGSAEASRSDRSVSGEASAQGRASR